ncbi:glycoside hydrolase family 38 N-terminal domain-containing protein, partial [Clavibacter michiganensis]
WRAPGASPQAGRSTARMAVINHAQVGKRAKQTPPTPSPWEALPGRRVYAPSPPVDSYNAALSGEDLARAARQHAEQAVSNASSVPFRWGDGGGGPTRGLTAAAHRPRDPEGAQRGTLGAPRAVCAAAQTASRAPAAAQR